MMTADSCARRRDSPCNEKVKPQITPKVAAPKVSKGRSESPLVASAEAKSPACGKELLCLKDRRVGRAHLARHSTDVGKSSLEALLRKREVTGRDASLPAPLLTFPLEWSPEKQLGRCPKPHKGRCPLTLQGALPLDPFFASRLVGSQSVIAIEAIIAPSVFAKRIVTRTAPDTSPNRKRLISTGATSKISPSADATIPTNIPPTTIATTPNTPGSPSVHRSALCSAASINPLSSANPIIRGDAACRRC